MNPFCFGGFQSIIIFIKLTILFLVQTRPLFINHVKYKTIKGLHLLECKSIKRMGKFTGKLPWKCNEQESEVQAYTP